MEDIYLLPEDLKIDSKIKGKLEKDYNHFAERFPENIEAYILDEYKIDLSSTYGGKKIKNPFGKASGQLSTNINQVQKDIDAGLGFIVLKTVIAEDEDKKSKMDAWKVNEPQMKVEKITSKTGREGWTVTWKGRGWSKSFQDYLDFMESSLLAGKKAFIPVIPSCQYHLPLESEEYNDKEYKFTTNKIMETWEKVFPNSPLMLEQDFSPTLLDSTLQNKEQFYSWIKEVTSRVKKTVDKDILLGLKLLNTPYSDEFQVDTLDYIFTNSRSVDCLVCFNRLFDPQKEFKGKKGVAYGGYDLSDRNLRVMTEFRKLQKEGRTDYPDIPISATGNIVSGRLMAEYALRGCRNGQIHTYFQLPGDQYKMKSGSHSLRALHELLFNPDDGLIASMIYINKKYNLALNDIVRFTDISSLYKNRDLFR